MKRSRLLEGRQDGRPARVAIIGGDGRHGRVAWPPTVDVRVYGSAASAGDGELRRLVAAIRAREVVLVVVLARWMGHSATSSLRRTCRRGQVPFLVWARGRSGLVRELHAGGAILAAILRPVQRDVAVVVARGSR